MDPDPSPKSPLNKRLKIRDRRLKHYGEWRRRVRQEREVKKQVDLRRGVEMRMMFEVHEVSKLRVELGEAWEEERREEDERQRLRAEAKEAFEREKRAGLVEDAELYGDDYDPFEEDY